MGLKYTILGGDKRSLELGNLLVKDGNDVCIYGFDKLEQYKDKPVSLNEAIEYADVIIAPLPFSTDNINVNAPFSNEVIQIDKVFNLISEKQMIMGGKFSIEHEKKLKKRNLKSADYFKREEMQILNAIPTAEGAIQVAMEEMPATLHNSNVIVLGFGRIGKILSKMLYGIGANVHVEARNYNDLAWIKNYSYIPIHLKELKTYLPRMNVVFNTIPQMILNKELLKCINSNCIIIDLASKPGGVDLEAAKELEIKTITALGLPGKVAPVSAATVIKDTIYNIIEELEV
ncbi:dipicolinate synthase subunit DpsA [Sedimentibacter sp. MB31-C6]|uniref:dipicolinate synthase subunit DpsA n=1 Tax=Sedimentibacter sp. MB31-C6 TaxID=3109366 RepID=UPI002DDD8AEA|nr:dipicolinate synthase subunit DpsA [Sedimentibacter sp. MB36-C1]WSI03200.1 dipicolinate synthase subunit DpsA [Sedimentibacter sp. MB36-C1]